MPFRIELEAQGRAVAVHWQGAVTGEDILTANEQMYARSDLQRLRYQIWDFSEADTIDLTPEQLREVISQETEASEAQPEQAVAIVGSAAFFRGIDRLYSILAEVWAGFQSETFRTHEEARAWIDSLEAGKAQDA